jgi:hypothetical protein
MLRAIAGAVVGYIVMAMVVVLGIAMVWNTMGNEFAFAGESNVASTPWSLCMLSFGAAAAVCGGMVASAIGGVRRLLSIKILLGLIVVLGALTLVGQMASTPKTLPEGTSIRDLTFFEAGEFAVSPAWYNIAVIFVGAAGVWYGGQILGKAKAQDRLPTDEKPKQ